MTVPSTQVTSLLTQFGLTTAAEELVPRLTEAGHPEAMPVLVEVFEAEAEARRQRRITRLRRASRLPPGKTFATLDTGRFPAPAYALVQELLGAKRDLDLPRALRKLDLFEAILLDDLGYVQQSPDEAEVLFTLLAERYERRSVLVTSNLIFSQWDRIFRDQMATAAAIDRLVHHAVVIEFDVPSYRTDRSRRKSPPAPAPRGRAPRPLLPRARRRSTS